MSRYIGNQCPVCNKDFMEDEDIVVCPTCGSPHHRDCYKERGGCGNEAYHTTARQWEETIKPADAHEDQEPIPVRCGNCGTPNPKENLFCNACGTKIGNEIGGFTPSQQVTQATQGVRTNGKATNSDFMQFVNSQIKMEQKLDQGVNMQEACDYIGPNSLIFAMKFKAFTMNRAVSFNWSAFFFGFFYCFYRKMYKLGGVIAALFIISVLPVAYYSVVAIQEIMATGTMPTIPVNFVMDGVGYQGLMISSLMARFVNMATMLFLGMFFNKMYYKEVTSQVARIKQSSRYTIGTTDFTMEIARKGGVNKYAILVIVAIMVALYIAFGLFSSLFILGI